MFSTPPNAVYYCYGVYDAEYGELPKDVILHDGLPLKQDIEGWTKNRNHVLIVLDDLLADIIKSQEIEAVFTRGCHHLGISVIFTSQNLFAQGKASRTIALNTTYMVLFKNVRDSSQIKCLARQVFPCHSDRFMAAYNTVMSEPYNYIILDMSPTCPDVYRVRTRTWIDEYPRIFHIK